MSQVTRYNFREDSPETGNNGATTFFSNSKCFHAHESQSELLIPRAILLHFKFLHLTQKQAVSQVKIYTGEAESRYLQPWLRSKYNNNYD
ncbi:hypothetical protein BLOT_012905 [Blomia tropicalis]|nr:hypothetical protein BLOT_012905 [Blomia tropicalis]